MRITELRVGDPVRRRSRLAIVISLVIVMAYGGVTILTKEIHGFDVHQPWQDDPYDVPVSFDFVFLPVLVVFGALRVQLCRRTEPLQCADWTTFCAFLLWRLHCAGSPSWLSGLQWLSADTDRSGPW